MGTPNLAPSCRLPLVQGGFTVGLAVLLLGIDLSLKGESILKHRVNKTILRQVAEISRSGCLWLHSSSIPLELEHQVYNSEHVHMSVFGIQFYLLFAKMS